MKKFTLKLLLTSLLYLLSLPLLSAGSLSGLVEAPVRVKKLIIYLVPEKPSELNTLPIKHRVSQKDTRFISPLLVINSGDLVEWANNEVKEIDHNIFSLSSLNRFDLGLGAKGSILSQVFHKTGVMNYYCSIHKEMEGKVVILPSRYYQLLQQPGTFKIDNIPAGIWTLKTIVFNRRYKVEPQQLKIGHGIVKNLHLKVIKR